MGVMIQGAKSQEGGKCYNPRLSHKCGDPLPGKAKKGCGILLGNPRKRNSSCWRGDCSPIHKAGRTVSQELHKTSMASRDMSNAAKG